MINKSMYDINGNDVNIGVLFTKIDRENRTVSGFATLDNRDSHGDVVSAEGSRSAFTRFRGGVREMHQPISVGKLLNFEEVKKYDPDTDAVYDGVYVKAYVSEGAEDTWKKVLDGTLKGFSIGGKVKRKSIGVDEEGDEYLIIDDYDLIELSLVDNPANPLANVVTVKKIGDRFVYEDDLLEKQVLNILISEESGDVILTEEEEREGFTNIGWTDSPDNVDKIKFSLHEWQSSKDDKSKSLESDDTDLLEETDGDIINNQEGGATMGTKNKEDETVEEVETTEVEKSADETTEESVTEATETEVEETAEEDEEVEKAADVSEVEEEETDSETDAIVSKVVDAITPLVTKAADAAKESSDAVESVKSSFDKTLDEKISELQKSVKDELDSLAERVEAVESDTAVKKSADIVVNDDDEEDNDEEESIWRGSFLSADALTKG